MSRWIEPLLTALALTGLTHLMLLAGRVPAGSDVPELREQPGPRLEEPDPLRAELRRLLREDLERRGLAALTPATAERSAELAAPPEADEESFGAATAEATAGSYLGWLQSLPGDLVSLQEAGPLRRFGRTLLTLAAAALCWLAGSMLGLFSGRVRGSGEQALWAGAALLASCVPVFCLSAFGYGSLLLAGAGAGLLGGLLADGFLGVRALCWPLPGYLQAAYGHGHRWFGAGESPRAFARSLDYQMLRPKLSGMLGLLRSRLPLLLGAVIVAELALDLQGLGRTFNNFDQQGLHGSFLTGVLLCFCLIRMYSWVLGRLEIRLDPVLSQRPAWNAGASEPLEHEPDFELTARGERRFVLLGLLGCGAVAVGQGWIALALGIAALRLHGAGRLPRLGGLGWGGLAMCSPFLLLPMLPSGWLEAGTLGAELASCGRKALVATVAVLLALRPLLVAELRGGALRQAADGLVHGLESLPQVLAAVILLRLGSMGIDRLGLEAPLLQQALMGLVYGLFGVAFLLRAVVGPLGSVRQRRHVRCSRALGLSDREVLSELLGGRMRRTLGSVAALVAGMAILLDLYVGFVFEKTLTTGGGAAAALGQILGREDLGASRGVALAVVVLCLTGLQLLRAALEEAPAS